MRYIGRRSLSDGFVPVIKCRSLGEPKNRLVALCCARFPTSTTFKTETFIGKTTICHSFVRNHAKMLIWVRWLSLSGAARLYRPIHLHSPRSNRIFNIFIALKGIKARAIYLYLSLLLSWRCAPPHRCRISTALLASSASPSSFSFSSRFLFFFTSSESLAHCAMLH